MELKKSLSVSLAALLIAGNMAAGISAVDYNDVKPENSFSEQIGILSDIGVIKGTGANEFSPDDKVTREQMALLLFRLMIGKDTAGTLNTTSFNDLYDETYSGAISWANASGYIIGTSASTFEPTGGITLQDAMTMLVRALGHSNTQMNNGYPWTFIDAAVKLGLDNGLEDVSYTKELTRAEVAGILYNALTAEYLIPKTASNGMTFFESTTIIERVFEYEMDESVLSATNNYAIGGLETVTKDGYVTINGEDGVLTVKYSELGLKGSADENLGKKLRVVYKRDDKTKLVSVLGCTELGKTETPESITVGNGNAYVEINGTKYQIVKKLSDALSTNANELLAYTYSENGSLTQIENNASLSKLLGVYEASLIFDSKDSETADRLIIKPYSFAKLNAAGGRLNIADNMKESDLSITNPGNAASGDYVLYYFNKENKTLEIKSVLPVSEAAVVTRIDNSSATIGGTKYSLGNSKLGISADTIRASLSVGEKARVVTLNGAILAVESASQTIYSPSKYLIAESTASPVFANGKFGYVIEANIGGTTNTIFVTSQNIEAGKVYRYTVEADGTYNLIPWTVSGGVVNSGINQFVQDGFTNDEIAFIVESANGTTITSNGAYYTLSKGNANAVTSTGSNESSISFVTDANSSIIVKKNGLWSVVSGRYASTIKIENGASVTAVFSNDPGQIETLRFLYISDGSLGSVDSSAYSVKVLQLNGRELVDGRVYTLYSVLNLSTGKIETMMSLESDLTVGVNYLTRVDGLISSETASVKNGILTGYTGTTVTVGGETFTMASDMTAITLNRDNTVSQTKLSDMYMSKVEVVFSNGVVKSLIRVADPTFTSSYSSKVITITANDDISDISSVNLVRVSSIDSETGKETVLSAADFTFDYANSGKLTLNVHCANELTAGAYRVTFSVNGSEFSSIVIVK